MEFLCDEHFSCCDYGKPILLNKSSQIVNRFKEVHTALHMATILKEFWIHQINIFHIFKIELVLDKIKNAFETKNFTV